MASQNGLFGRSLLCHSILKFSHSTLPRHASPSGWNHIQAPDIFALVEQLDHDNIQLRIVQGTNDLEVLPLTAIIRETRELHKRQPKQSPDNLPIFGLTKGTALAVRYFCQNNQVRRIQLRFTDEACCNEAVQLLSGHGLMFSMPPAKQNTQPQSRPMTASSYVNRQPSIQSARFDRETSSIIVPTIQDAFPSTSSYAQQNSTQQTSDLTNLHMFTSSPGPKEYETRVIQREPTFGPIRTSEEPAERPSTAPIQWPSDMARTMLPPRRELPFPKPSSSPAKTKMLPPLPKPSYASEAAKSENLSKEESRSNTSPEKKVNPGITRLSTPRGPTRFEPPVSRMYNYQPSDESMTVFNESPGYRDTPAREPNQDVVADTDQRYRSSASPVHFASSSPKDKPLPSPESSGCSSLEQTTFSSPSERRSQRLAQKYTIYPEIDDVEMTGASPQQNTQQTPGMQDVEMATTNPPQQSAQDALRQYAEQSNETRAKALEQFIVASLEDDAFLKLCVDVEACWQRQLLDRRL
ncbi:hypothetical protein E4T48_01147 [Aureobasidium sp. EXF-10727]|nr:hypothetical protein E4T48_01147 [Aureobasidium sp. EXF-10727]